MSSLTLEPSKDAEVAAWLKNDDWLIACLCAAWCDTCNQYRAGFEALAQRHPDQRFVWIDIEDRADLVGDIDVENFPTLLIQRGGTVAFFGTVLPDAQLAERLMQAQFEKSGDELQAEAAGSAERRQWQQECNLQAWLAEAGKGR